VQQCSGDQAWDWCVDWAWDRCTRVREGHACIVIVLVVQGNAFADGHSSNTQAAPRDAGSKCITPPRHAPVPRVAVVSVSVHQLLTRPLVVYSNPSTCPRPSYTYLPLHTTAAPAHDLAAFLWTGDHIRFASRLESNLGAVLSA
jgi:hypothetical protein